MSANLTKAAAALGRKGGQARSEAKTQSCRENAKRPRSDAPRCNCGAMTLKRATARGHKC